VEDLLNYATGFASVAVLGVVKKYTGIADTKIGAFVRPIQPVLALGLAIGLPFAAKALRLTTEVDPAQVAAAPTATIIAIAAAEVLSRITKKK
jgi:hypothetical protein